MAKVILSVPHAACGNEQDKKAHTCDLAAERVARKLFDYLTDKEHKVYLRIGDVNRVEMDLNRPEARDSTFRKRLESSFKNADFLLDVHSYPGNNAQWGEDVILLKWNKDGNDNRKHVYDLMDGVVRSDLSAAVADATQEDDVIVHAMENNLPAILVEFSEIAVEDAEKDLIKRFADVFARFLEKLEKRVSESVDDLLPKLVR